MRPFLLAVFLVGALLALYESATRRLLAEDAVSSAQSQVRPADEGQPAAAHKRREDDAPNKPWIAVGRVTDPHGQPMPDVKVRAATGWGTLLGGGSTMTDADGKYELRFGPGIRMVSEGPYCQAAVIGATKEGFCERNLNRQGDCLAAMSHDLDETIDVSKLETLGKPAESVFVPGVAKEINFVMVPAVKASGRLVDAEGKPLAGYSVWLTGEVLPPAQNVIESDVTDAAGRFDLADLPLGLEFQFLVRPPHPEPPWNAWASLPMTFAAPGKGELHATLNQGESKLEVTAQKFELQVLGEGVDWRKALENGPATTAIRVLVGGVEKMPAPSTNVRADVLRLSLGAQGTP
ncbi:MAG: carboxypeptidase-like regulatory domain-containing protein [Singulisphaera sp.]